LRRPNPGEQFKKDDAPFVDHDFEARYPTITEYLTAVTWDDGKPRVTSTILIFMDGRALKVCLNDRDNNRSVFISDPTFTGAMDRLEQGLAENSLEWRSRQNYNSTNAKPNY